MREVWGNELGLAHVSIRRRGLFSNSFWTEINYPVFCWLVMKWQMASAMVA